MYRYTTPTIPITIDTVDFADVDFFRIAIRKSGVNWIFTFSPDDDNVDDESHTIFLSLTQEQTTELTDGMAQIQVRIKFKSGSVQATNIAKVSIKDVLDEVII